MKVNFFKIIIIILNKWIIINKWIIRVIRIIRVINIIMVKIRLINLVKINMTINNKWNNKIINNLNLMKNLTNKK